MTAPGIRSPGARPLVIAHRGASAERPENTLGAFDRALEVGADMIELDVRASRDGVLYVAHDPVLEPPRRGLARGPLDWPSIRQLGAASGAFPSLAEVLERYGGRIELNLEIKERRAAPLLLGEVARTGRTEGLLFSSFDRWVVRYVRATAPRLRLGLLAVRTPVRLEAAIARSGAVAYHARRTAVRPRVVRRAHASGVPVYVWTVDNPAELVRLASWGVDGFFTNDPGAALRLFAQGGGSPQPPGVGPRPPQPTPEAVPG